MVQWTNLQWIEKFVYKSDVTRLYITRENSGDLYLAAEPGLMPGRLADEIWERLKILKASCRSKS